MKIEQITYKIKTTTEEQLYFHMVECNNCFYPPLDERVNIRDYSKKLFDKSTTFEAWVENKLVGCVAVYFNTENNYAYISNVSVVKEYMGFGIASVLLKNCIQQTKTYQLNQIILEVNKQNIPAINLYKKLDFKQFDIKNELLIMKLNLDPVLKK